VSIRRVERREFLGTLALSPVLGALAGRAGKAGPVASKPTDVRIAGVSYSTEDFRYRAPYKFGGQEVDRATILNVHCTVETRRGHTAHGFGSMTLGNVWSFPSLPYDVTLGAMKTLAERLRKITADYQEFGHPIDLNVALEQAYLEAAADVSRQLRLAEPIPKLCTLVTASPFDAALHDAFGKAHHVNCYQTLGPDFMAHDLAHYLTPAFQGEYLDRYVLREPKARLALYHSVGASDPIVEGDIKKRIGDGLPETLPEWIRWNGLTHFKIKLNGNDLDWDVERVVGIDRVASGVERERHVSDFTYSLDFNEKCPNVRYLLDFLDRVKQRTPAGFARIQYVEQPTARDLAANRSNVMHAASKLVPVVIDESLTGLESLELARQMGYTGVALKACKGITQSLLMAAAAQKYKMFLCVQDLTCPGASLVENVGLAAHVPGVTAIEANAREYVPSASKGWESRFPGIFVVKDGTLKTANLNGAGLGVVS